MILVSTTHAFLQTSFIGNYKNTLKCVAAIWFLLKMATSMIGNDLNVAHIQDIGIVFVSKPVVLALLELIGNISKAPNY